MRILYIKLLNIAPIKTIVKIVKFGRYFIHRLERFYTIY